MTLIEWKAGFSVGSAAIDHEHRQLIHLINDVHDGIRNDAGADALAEGLGEIYAQIAAHFALEEKLMRDAGYEDLIAHKDDHESLLDQLADILHGVEVGGEYDEAALSARLERWFSGHFSTHDAKLHRQL